MADKFKGQKTKDALAKKLYAVQHGLGEILLWLVVNKRPNKGKWKENDKEQNQKQNVTMQKLSKTVRIILYELHHLFHRLKMRQGKKFDLAYN